MRLLAGFGKRHVYLALGFGLVVQLAHSTYALLGKEDLHAVPMLAWAVLFFFLALIGLGCAVAIDNLLGDSAPTGTRLVLAMVAAAIVTTLAVELLFYLLPQGLILAIEGQEKAPFVSDFHRIAFRFTTSAGWSLMLAAAPANGCTRCSSLRSPPSAPWSRVI
jgi:predicted secreted protein